MDDGGPPPPPTSSRWVRNVREERIVIRGEIKPSLVMTLRTAPHNFSFRWNSHIVPHRPTPPRLLLIGTNLPSSTRRRRRRRRRWWWWWEVS